MLALSVRYATLPLAAALAAGVLTPSQIRAEPGSEAAQPGEEQRREPGGQVAPEGSAAATSGDDMTAPSLKDHPEAPYPAQALADKVEGNVGLELDLDAGGNVVAVRVTTPAGHGFDEAAAEAAKRFTFQPAKRRGVPVASTVQFTYEFHLPPEPPAAPSAVAPPPPPPAELTQSGPNQSTLVLGTKPISAASSFSMQDRDFQLRPIGSVQDILRVTPGLVMVQHSGGGKANQYFLRGFDADHGTDLALSIDGVPINLVAHAHGQGFADTNFIIPEVIERVEITKGPYFANQGDFATAGAVNMVSRDDFEHSAAAFGIVGSPGSSPAPGSRTFPSRRRSRRRSAGRTGPSTTQRTGTSTSCSTSSPTRPPPPRPCR
jgi:TonB family protein